MSLNPLTPIDSFRSIQNSDISTKIKKFHPVLRFWLGKATFVDTMILLPIQSNVLKKVQMANCDLYFCPFWCFICVYLKNFGKKMT